jgi:putative N6-adenine-specific DNA methylase
MEEATALSVGASVPGFIVTNPPYGRRRGESAEADERYGSMAGLCKTFPGWKLALICDHPGFESCFGRKADNCRELKSGAIDTWLYQYEKL